MHKSTKDLKKQSFGEIFLLEKYGEYDFNLCSHSTDDFKECCNLSDFLYMISHKNDLAGWSAHFDKFCLDFEINVVDLLKRIVPKFTGDKKKYLLGFYIISTFIPTYPHQERVASLLWIAVKLGDINLVKLIIKLGVHPDNDVDWKRYPHFDPKKYITPLMAACENTNCHDNVDDIITILLDAGANINLTRNNDDMAIKLYLERKSPNVKILSRLIDVHIYVKIKNSPQVAYNPNGTVISFFRVYSSQNELLISRKLFQPKYMINNLKHYDVVTEPEFEFIFTSGNDICVLCDGSLFDECPHCPHNECPKVRCRCDKVYHFHCISKYLSETSPKCLTCNKTWMFVEHLDTSCKNLDICGSEPSETSSCCVCRNEWSYLNK
jgi:hypothetical protein